MTEQDTFDTLKRLPFEYLLLSRLCKETGMVLMYGGEISNKYSDFLQRYGYSYQEWTSLWNEYDITHAPGPGAE